MAKKPAKNSKAEKEYALYRSKEYGLSPYNAAIKAGFSVQKALILQEKANAEKVFTESFRDIAEQEGATPRTIVRHLIKMAGLNDREEGAKQIKGTDDSFVEAPCDKTQLLYLRELISFCDLGAAAKMLNEDGTEEGAGDVFNISIKVLNVTTEQKEKIVNGEKKPEEITDVEVVVDA